MDPRQCSSSPTVEQSLRSGRCVCLFTCFSLFDHESTVIYVLLFVRLPYLIHYFSGTTMIGTVSTGRCPMPPARDRSGTLNHFFLRILKYQIGPKVIILFLSSETFFAGKWNLISKDPIVSIIIILVFFQVQEG